MPEVTVKALPAGHDFAGRYGVLEGEHLVDHFTERSEAVLFAEGYKAAVRYYQPHPESAPTGEVVKDRLAVGVEHRHPIGAYVIVRRLGGGKLAEVPLDPQQAWDLAMRLLQQQPPTSLAMELAAGPCEHCSTTRLVNGPAPSGRTQLVRCPECSPRFTPQPFAPFYAQEKP